MNVQSPAVPDESLLPVGELPPQNGVRKLTVRDHLPYDARVLICQLLGQYHTTTEINQVLKERYHVAIHPVNIQRYRHHPKWALLIKQFRATYLGSIMEIPISHQVVRLDRLERLYQKAMVNEEVGEARQILQDAAEEMDKTKGPRVIYVHQDIVQMNTVEIEQRRVAIVDRLKQLGGQDAIREASPALP